MTKDISTLKRDIDHVLKTGEGYTDEIAEWVGSIVQQSLIRQFKRDGRKRTGLRVSSMGTPCERRLWYSTVGGVDGEPLPPYVLNKFIFGDLTEAHILGLAKASGHDVDGLQTRLDCLGVPGSRDCVIDGVLIDVKSTSSQSFKKFEGNGLRKDDPFGYLSQLSSYLYASRNDPIVKEKTKAGFLAFDKQFGHIVVDIYDLTEELDRKEEEVAKKKAVVSLSKPPARVYEAVPHNKSGNMKLPNSPCGYCEWKHHCWENLRGFAYSNGPVWLTKVVEEPRGSVLEITKGKPKF